MVSLGLLVLRMIVGGIFFLHGYTKAFGGKGKSEQIPPELKQVLGSGFVQSMDNGGIENTAGFIKSLDMPNPKAAAIALTATELGGGLALILGWWTRPAALALLVSQVVAVDKVHAKQGLIAPHGFEFNASLMAATACLFLAGPGAIAMD